MRESHPLMGRTSHTVAWRRRSNCRRLHLRLENLEMPNLAIFFVLFAVVLIAAYFYLMRAKARDSARRAQSGETTGDQGQPR